jgi:plastocyanin
MGSDRFGRLPTVALALLVPLIALVTVLVTLGVTSDDTGTAAIAGGERADTITIKNFQFSPDPLVADAGTPVTVTNADGTAHTVTANDGAFDTGDLDGGATKTITVDAPGTYKYFCEIHNYMTGTIEVR